MGSAAAGAAAAAAAVAAEDQDGDDADSDDDDDSGVTRGLPFEDRPLSMSLSVMAVRGV
jgi:hypothetical protein